MKKIFSILMLLTINVFSVTKTSNSNGNWNNASIWTPSGVPTSNDKIYINHVVTLNQNFTASDTIFVNNTLNIGSNRILTLSPGTMILVNDITNNGRIGTVGNGGNIIGNYTFQKYVTRCDGWSTYGSPFTTPLSDLGLLHTGFVGCPWYPSYTWVNTSYYDETQPGTLTVGYYNPTSISSNNPRGVGFFYYYANAPSLSSWNFPRVVSLQGSTNFTTSFSFSVSFTNNSTSANRGWNLVANPYPGTIDWNDGGWTKSKVNNAVYVWNTCTGSYASYVGGVGVNGGSRYIPTLQGFWVKTRNINPLLISTSAVMVTNSQPLLKTMNSQDTTNNSLHVTLKNDEIAIRLDSLSTDVEDSLTDAIKLFGDSSFIYSYIYGDSLEYAINTVKDSIVKIVPLKVKGSGTLNFSNLTSFLNYSVYLHDIQTNQTYPISNNYQYTYTQTPVLDTVYDNRFYILFSKLTANINETELSKILVVYPNPIKDYLVIESNSYGEIEVKIYDMMGKEILTKTYNDKKSFINTSDFNEGIYIVKIISNNNIISKKLIKTNERH